MRAYPSSNSIAANSRILIQGWANSIPVLKNLNIKHEIFLVSKHHKVKLEVEETLESDFNKIEVFLRPSKKLKPGKVYTLVIENTEEQPTKLINNTYNDTIASWLVSNESDNIVPEIMYSELIETKIQLMGCGVPKKAIFKVNTTENTTVIFRTELLNPITNKTQVFYVLHSNYELETNQFVEVGKDMCSGDFNVEVETPYKVRFKAVDFSGNTNDEWTAWFDFEINWEN